MSERTHPVPNDIVEFFKRHLVPIHVSYAKGSDSKHEVYSAFLIDIADYWWLVTAGHCLSEIEFMHTAGYKTPILLLDTVREDSKYDHPIPYGYDPNLAFHLYKPGGFDYGLLQIDPNHRQLLEANRAVALDQSTWKQRPDQFDFYRLIGVAGEFTSSDGENANVCVSMHAINPLSERPECFSESTVPRFYGRISLGEPLTHIRGLSGGPILGFRQVDDRLRYWLHAIQSGWNPGTREISACFVGPFAMYVEELILSIETEESAGLP